ncbi:MAG: cytidylyltransferase domain-containing protein [Verrucomicrobiaceae bacterium]
MEAGPASEMKIGAIIQARCGSVRFPNKVLMGLPMAGGASVLAHIFRRVEESAVVESCVVATSDASANDAIEAAFPGQVFRGDEDDVLRRMYECAKERGLEVVVRLTGDNPCVDFSLLDGVIAGHVAEGADYTITSGLPLGMNAEVVSFDALKQAHEEAVDPYEREHVMPFVVRRAGRFKVRTVALEAPESTKGLRLTMDYPSDYALLNLIFGHFEGGRFSLAGLGELVASQPWMREVNPNHQKREFASEEAEVEAAVALLEKAELLRAAERLKRGL